MLCFTGSKKGLQPGIEFWGNSMQFGSANCLTISRELKQCKDQSIKRRFCGLCSTVFRCAVHYDRQFEAAKLLPIQPGEESALVLLHVGHIRMGMHTCDFKVRGESQVLLTDFKSDGLGSKSGDFTYLLIIAPNSRLTFSQMPAGCSRMHDVFSIEFDGKNARFIAHPPLLPFQNRDIRV